MSQISQVEQKDTLINYLEPVSQNKQSQTYFQSKQFSSEKSLYPASNNQLHFITNASESENIQFKIQAVLQELFSLNKINCLEDVLSELEESYEFYANGAGKGFS